MQTLDAALLFAVVQGLLYAYVGSRLRRRPVSAAARAAHRAFLLWWFSLAASSLATAGEILLFRAGALPVWLFQTVGQGQLILIVAALGGLMYYLLYLYRGRRDFVPYLVLYYAVFYLALEALVFYSLPRDPQVGTVNGWDLALVPQQAFSNPVIAGLLALLLGPQLAGAVAYALLFRTAEDKTVRFRIAVVSSTIIVWFGTAFFLAALAAPDSPSRDGIQLGTRILGLAAASSMLVAYLPPHAWRRRWGLRGIDDESPTAQA